MPNRNRKIIIVSTILMGLAIFAPNTVHTLSHRPDDTQKTIDEIKEQMNQPSTRIKIPGLEFTNTSDVEVIIEGADKYINVPFLGEFMTAVFRYGIVVAGLAAVIMIIVGGVQWIMSGGNANLKTTAKSRIVGAVSGLIIALSSYIILYTINPHLVEFKNLKILYVDEFIEPESEIEHLEGNTEVALQFDRISGDNIRGNGRLKVAIPHIKDLKEVAEIMAKDGLGIFITDGVRTIEEQKRQILKKCNNPPGSEKCNPKDGKTTACMLKNNNPANCPHTTGYALDVWGAEKIDGKWKQCIFQASCSKNKDNDDCRRNPCHAKLIQAMLSKGFCVLNTEAWHFEKPVLNNISCSANFARPRPSAQSAESYEYAIY
jgi:D-alanyl-D-alanine dipeptidase